MKDKVRILGIAPYPGLVALMNQYAKQRPDIDLIAMLGNMENGLRLAQEHYNNYDIIISRANTASMISREIPTPVIDIGIGYYDVLRCIKMAESTRTKFAVLGFHSLTTIAQTICDLLRTPIDIFPISSMPEAITLLNKMKESNYETVICDTVAYNYAKLVGITPILLTSSIESLESAIDNAAYIWQTHKKLYNSLSMMKLALNSSESRCLILDMDGNCLCTTLHGDTAASICRTLQDELPKCCAVRKRSFFITIDNQMYSVVSNLETDGSQPYVIFCIMRSEIPLSYSKYGITVMDKERAEKSFLGSFYSNTELSRKILSNTEETAASGSSLMITGEIGTGKDRVAHIYYAKSAFCDNLLYVVNCCHLSEKSWKFIINHYNSPFTDTGNTIYISNLDFLPNMEQKRLLSIILDTNLHVRNRLILSCTQQAGKSLPHVAVEYMNALGCILVPIRPLREEREDIAASAGLYLDTLNQELMKQVVGLDDEAITLLEQFNYPYNRTQFKRILKEAVLKTDTPYISRETVLEILEQESVLSPDISPAPGHEDGSCADNLPPLNLNQSLDAINRDIVQYILKSCDNNHTAAAKKLGISRTTLWRYMKR